MKKVLLVSVLLGGMMVGCSQETDKISFEQSIEMQEEEIKNNQFSIECQSDKGCYFEYKNNGEKISYDLETNEKLYFNFPDDGRIIIFYREPEVIENAFLTYNDYEYKVYSNHEISSPDDSIINENEIILK